MAQTGGRKIKGLKQAPVAPQGPRKLHAGTYVHDAAYDIDEHDMGPWVQVNSTRVRAIRYDFMNAAVQVHWHNKPDALGYIYLDVPEETFNSFVRSGSKGKFVNSTMNNFDYRPMTPDEMDAPANARRR